MKLNYINVYSISVSISKSIIMSSSDTETDGTDSKSIFLLFYDL